MLAVGAVGSTVKVSVFLQETVTGADKSIINTDGGLFGAGVMVNRTGAGDATFQLTGAGTIKSVFAENRTPSPTGFGGIDPNDGVTPIPPTQVDRTPSTTTSAGLIVNADTTANAASSGNQQGGPQVANPGTAGVYKILLGTLNVIVGNQATTFTVSNYGAHGDTVTQAKTDLDFSGTAAGPTATPYTGASTPVGGFYTFSVAGAAVPEPTSMALCGLLASGMGYFGYRRRKTTATVA